MTKDEALRMAMAALEYSVEELMGYSVDMSGEEYNSPLLNDAITAIREALADSALERMAKNERELGIDYMRPAEISLHKGDA